MHVVRLELQNFRCFERYAVELADDFNVLAGPNGSGKTALLDALAIALSSFFYGFHDGPQPLTIDAEDVRQQTFEVNRQFNTESQFPSLINCTVQVMGERLSFIRRRTKITRERSRMARSPSTQSIPGIGTPTPSSAT